MEETTLVVCRLCLGFTSTDESQMVDSPLKQILQDILPEINLEISHDPKICPPCNKNVLKCYEFKSSCNREHVQQEIKTEPKTDDEVTEVQIQEEKKCDFCFSKISEEAFIEFSVRREFFNEVLKKCLPDWFQKITKQKSAVPCGECLENFKSHFTFMSACLTTEEKIRKYCSTYGTNSQGKVNLVEVIKTDKGLEENNTCEMETTLKPLKDEPIDIKHEVYEGRFVRLMETDEDIELPGTSDEVAATTDGEGTKNLERPQTPDHRNCYEIIGGRTFLKRGAVLHLFEVTKPEKRQNKDAQLERSSEAKQPKMEIKQEFPCLPPNTRSVGTQVREADLIPRCEIAIQVECDHLETSLVGGHATPEVSHKATTCTLKVKEASPSNGKLPLQKKRPIVITKTSLKARK